jgi:hypothetical protein
MFCQDRLGNTSTACSEIGLLSRGEFSPTHRYRVLHSLNLGYLAPGVFTVPVRLRVRKVLVFALILAVGACADSHQVQRSLQAPDKLSRAATAYVSVPQDGRYGHKVYSGSGLTTAQIVAGAFTRQLTRVEQAAHPETHESALEAAKKMGATYLISPSIAHWEDRATEWSLLSDKVEVQISVYDPATGRLLERGVVSGRSGWATLGGDHPQDLLPQPIKQFVDGLF